jgi:hypothetical protein
MDKSGLSLGLKKHKIKFGERAWFHAPKMKVVLTASHLLHFILLPAIHLIATNTALTQGAHFIFMVEP